MESALDGPQGRIHEDDGEPRVTALVLAYEFQGLLDAGVVNTRAEIAGRYGFSRARVTQVMSLLRLPESIRDHLSALPPDQQRLYSERRLREIVAVSDREAQLERFSRLVAMAEPIARRRDGSLLGMV